MPLEIRRAGETRGGGRAACLTTCHIARKVAGSGTFELEARRDVPHKLRTLHDGHARLGRARRAARWPLCALVLTMLTGCLMVGPDFQSPPPPGVAGFLPNSQSVPGAAVI